MNRRRSAARNELWRLLAQSTTLVVLCLIVADLADAACDPLRIPGDRSAQWSVTPEQADACADFCVPDCFCCSRGVPAMTRFSMPETGAAPGRLPERLENLLPGVTSLVDHVPLATL